MPIRSSSTIIGLTFLFLTSFLFLNISINAQGTDVTSDITSDTMWTLAGSPYVVKQDISITTGSTLTIQPSIVVKFSGYFFLSVSGALIVGGTPTGKVIFTYDSATPSPGSWDGIRFLSTSDDASSSITSATILYAAVGLYLDQSSPMIDDVEVSYSLRKGIDVFQSSPLIENSKINEGLGTGIKSYGGSPTIQDTEISGNANGIELVSSNAFIQRNLIKSNGIGILTNSSSPTILDNDITLNQEGIEADYGSNPSVQGNTFSFNTKAGFWLLGDSSAFLQDNTFTGNSVGVEIEESQVLIEQASVSTGRISLRAEESSYASVWNSSLLASEENSLYLEQGSTVVLTNTDFNAASLYIESDCTLFVRNFLTVEVLDADDLPLKDVAVTLESNQVVVESLLTGHSGLTDTVVVLDRTYDGKTTADHYTTTAEVEVEGKEFEENPREVDMSTSHTEVFREKSPTTNGDGLNPEDGSQSMLFLIPLIVIVVSVVVAILLIRRRKRKEAERKSRSRRKTGKKRRSRSR